MKGKITEKRIYELLGVNLFRKYVLGPYQEIYNGLFFITGLTKFFGIKDIYKMRDFSTEGLKNYKKLAKTHAIEHVCSFILMSAIFCLGDLPTFITYWAPFVMITDVYAIMTQRYHHIRINEILEKREKLQKRREERASDEVKIENEFLPSKSQEFTPITLEEEKPLSLEEQRKELENLRDFVNATNMAGPFNEDSIYTTEKGGLYKMQERITAIYTGFEPNILYKGMGKGHPYLAVGFDVFENGELMHFQREGTAIDDIAMEVGQPGTVHLTTKSFVKADELPEDELGRIADLYLSELEQLKSDSSVRPAEERISCVFETPRQPSHEKESRLDKLTEIMKHPCFSSYASDVKLARGK